MTHDKILRILDTLYIQGRITAEIIIRTETVDGHEKDQVRGNVEDIYDFMLSPDQLTKNLNYHIRIK